MNRRKFIKGILATSALVAVPSLVLGFDDASFIGMDFGKGQSLGVIYRMTSTDVLAAWAESNNLMHGSMMRLMEGLTMPMIGYI
jgi:hypothetical protein